MKFGLDTRKQLTGADLYVRAMQIAAILPVPFVFVSPGYPALLTQNSVFSAMFDLGLSILPRAETFGLSLLYRGAVSELAAYFAMLIWALAFGLIMKPLLQNFPRAVRLVCIGLIAADLVVRLLPLHCNQIFALPYAAAGFAVRLGCLALLLLDLRAAKKAP